MAKLRTEHKRFIVTRLALFDTPSEVRDALAAEFGVTVSLPQVLYYDPTSAGTEVAQALRALFDEVRAKAREETEDIAIAHRAVRLRRLDRMARLAEERKNYALAAQLLEQAAKECGDAYTNSRKHQVTGANGAPLGLTVVIEGNGGPEPADAAPAP